VSDSSSDRTASGLMSNPHHIVTDTAWRYHLRRYLLPVTLRHSYTWGLFPQCIMCCVGHAESNLSTRASVLPCPVASSILHILFQSQSSSSSLSSFLVAFTPNRIDASSVAFALYIAPELNNLAQDQNS